MLQQLKQWLGRGDRSGAVLLGELSADERGLIARIRERRLTYLSEQRLASLVLSLRRLERDKVEGMVIEAGCALGGSAILLATLKNPNRGLRVYDVFGMIPPPTKEDTGDVHERYKVIVEGRSTGIDGDPYYGYEKNLYDLVVSNLESFGIRCAERNVELIKGLIQDTMVIDGPVALAHVDVDWYEPVMTCLERIFPRLAVGGSIVLDDYHAWSGCRKATDEFVRTVVGQLSMDDSAGSMKLTRIRA